MTSEDQNPVNVLLADDHNIVRQGIQFIVQDLLPDAVIHHAASLSQINSRLAANQIDIAILDAQLPDGNCISLLPEIRQLYPDLRIMMFTSFDEESYSVRFIHAGANGFLSKLSEEAEIRSAVSELIEKGEYYPPLTRTLLRLSANDPDRLDPLGRLSERELEIADLYSTGLGNLEIANRLSIRQNTVSTYKKRIFEKLNISTLVELIELVKIYRNF